MPKKINLKLYDIDGCLFHAYIEGQPVQTWLLASNAAFLEKQCADIAAHDFDKVILALGTNRQDWYTDYHNSRKGGSCIPALPLLQHYFQQHLDNEVVLDPFMKADIDSGKSAGESFKTILKKLYNDAEINIDTRYIFDYSKVSLLYTHAHRVADLHPEAEEIVIDFYDDTPQILQSVYTFFNKYPDLLPRNVVLNIHHYNGGEVKPYGNPIQGNGITDKQYNWTTLHMSSMSKIQQNMLIDRNIGSAEVLQRYRKYICDRPLHNEQMNVTVEHFNIEKFRDFRAKEIPKLASAMQGLEANYTTAAALCEEKCLPENVLTGTACELPLFTLTACDFTLLEEKQPALVVQPEEEEIQAMLEKAKRVSGSLENHLQMKCKKNKLTISEYITILDSASVSHITLDCPHEFNLVETIKQIITENNWQSDIHHSFWRKLQKTDDFDSLVKIIKRKLMQGQQSNKLSDFDSLISTIQQARCSDAVSCSAINTFHAKWNKIDKVNVQNRVPLPSYHTKVY